MPDPDDLTATDDLTLVRSARAGDRLAFGVLYLRHHAAAWRLACVASRFSPDAELAVIEGFTRVFSALPEESGEFEAGGVTFRPYLLACVRQAALDRARAAGRAEASAERGRGRRSRPTGPPVPMAPPAALAGLAPSGEVLLSSLEHHVARGALAALPERSRTALWLSDVEALTPGEIAGILGAQPHDVAGLASGARTEIHAAQQSALGRQEVRADCRFTVDRLDAFHAGTLDPSDGLIVRSHLDRCPPCRMRRGELANAPAALAGAVPAAPLLGGEAQHHWLTVADDVRPADRLLPPGLAAGGSAARPALARRTATRLGTAAGAATAPARKLPDLVRRVARAAAATWGPPLGTIDLTTRAPRPAATGFPGETGSPGLTGSPTPALPPAWTIPPGRATTSIRTPTGPRRPARPVRTAHREPSPHLPTLSLILAALVVPIAVFQLIAVGTTPDEGTVASPVVQAYVPAPGPSGGPTHGRAPRAGGNALQNGSTTTGAATPAGSPSVAEAAAGPRSVAGSDGGASVELIAAGPSRPVGTLSARRSGPRTIGLAPALVPVTVAAPTIPAPVLAVTPIPIVTTTASNPGPIVTTTASNPGPIVTPGSTGNSGSSAPPAKPRKPAKPPKPAKPGTPQTPALPEAPMNSWIPFGAGMAVPVPQWPSPPTAGMAGPSWVWPSPAAGPGGGSAKKWAVPRARIITT